MDRTLPRTLPVREGNHKSPSHAQQSGNLPRGRFTYGSLDKSSQIDLIREHVESFLVPAFLGNNPITRGQTSTQNCGRDSAIPISKLDAYFLRSTCDSKAPAADVTVALQVAFDALGIQASLKAKST